MPDAQHRDGGAPARLSVIVPVNRPWQYELNIARSPGLREIGAEIIPVQGARSAGEAFRLGAAKASHAWRVMVHQDVYWPTGSGFAMSQQLGAQEQAGLSHLPTGFAGLEPEAARPGFVRHVGLVIDRQARFAHGRSGAAVSIDEFAVALHRDCPHPIDDELGWHLWGTDLCLQAQRRHGRAVAQVLEVPLFHNSTNDFRLPPEFEASAQQLLDKYPDLARIPTLCGEIERRVDQTVSA